MIHLIIGPMFSGKSTELIRRLKRAKIAGRKVILIKPSIDKRGILTHDDKEVGNKNDFNFIFVDDLNNLDYRNYDVIGIDEGQFFKNLSYYANKWASESKEVIVAGLDATSEQIPFDEIINLIPFSEEVIKLNAICTKCGSEYGAFTFYKAGEKKEKIKIGGKELYEARCRMCLEK
ncbi:MAG: thymidine kinase [Spirochaetes bacterium]|nr:thymidine kinase [Spirochaetota bacterium]